MRLHKREEQVNGWFDLNLRKDKQYLDVEFRLNRSETSYHAANHETSFLDERIYDLFSSCFAESIEHGNQFNYYGPTKFRRNELLNLRTCLSQVESELKSIASFESFTNYFDQAEDSRKRHVLSLLNDQFQMELEWAEVLAQIVETNRSLINLVSRCIRENRVLWVLGL